MENYGILLVDDEQAYGAIVSALLQPRGGAVDCATNRATALEAIEKRRYDLVLIDIHMDGYTGYDLVGEMRRAAEWARTSPILAFTTQHLSGGERHYIDAGFDGWLPKPFHAAELISRVQRWLGRDLMGTIADPPQTKLAALLGAEAAKAMVARFYKSLAAAIDEIDGGGDRRAIGHRLGGLAGTLGHAMLGAAWLGLEEGDGLAWPTVRALTLEAIARHDSGSSLT